MAAGAVGRLRRPAAAMLVVLAVLLSLTGCTRSSQATPVGSAIVVFIDFSQSLQGQDRALFREDLEKQILPSLGAGDRLLIAGINDRTFTSFRPLVEATFPPQPAFNGWQDNVMKFNKLAKETDTEVDRLRKQIKKQVDDMFAARHFSQQTDIFSSLTIAEKLFHDESRRKVLVLMSDMIEDYPPYNFERISWGPDTSRKVLGELEANGQIPKLNDVCIYVAGASANSAALAESIGRFWLAYFKRARAQMDSSRYAHVLLHWPPSKSCR